MKKLLLPLLLLGLALPALAAPASVTTTKRTAVAIGNGSFALVKGTKLEVVAREGDMLLVKYRASQGKIPVADTDYPADATATEGTEPAPAAPAAKPTPAVAKPAATTPATSTPPAKAAPAPALDPMGKPATNYGKAVQKAKQATEAHKSTHVDPTKGIMDDEPQK